MVMVIFFIILGSWGASFTLSSPEHNCGRWRGRLVFLYDGDEMMIAKYKCVVLLLLCTMCGIYLPCPKGGLLKLNFVLHIYGLIIRQLPIISDGLLIWLIMGDQWSLIMVDNMVYHGWQSDKFQSSQMLHTATLGLHHKLIPSDYRGGEVYFFLGIFISIFYLCLSFIYI